jgi:putative DNA primase/helicase
MVNVRSASSIRDPAAMMARTVDRAQHRWREILPQLGIESRFLSIKQGPCPLCGGRTRFRFDDRDGNGTWICNYCGAGAGLHLVMKVNRWDYAPACNAVDQVIGRDQPIGGRPPAAPRDGTRARLRIEGIIRAANHPNIVIEYLLSRGLSITSPVLLGHPACEYWQDKVLIGRYPAVIAPVMGPDGQLESVHRI